MRDGKLIEPGKWYTEFDENGNFVTAIYDESYRRALGYDSEEEYAKSQGVWESRIHPEDEERINAHHADCIAKHPEGKDFDIEYRMMTKTGYRWFHDYAHITRSEDGTIRYADGVIFDIQDIVDKENIHQSLVENYGRFFALEDNFESLYDVEIESGHYVSYVRGDFYQKNVMEKLVEPTDYFEDLRDNINAVIFKDDIDELYNSLTREAVCRELSENEHYDHYYRLNAENGPIWFRMRIVYKNADKKNVIIGVFNAAEEMAAKEKEEERLKNAEMMFRHEQLRAEVSNYMVSHDDDPIELLKQFAERLRVLINCDQVIYRDLEETRIMVNSPAIEDTWAVPIEFCMQCEHFDAHHPMYKDGYTEMDNCQEGWQGIPVYHECPIKSSLTRIVYCDGDIAGYLAIHYVQDYHHFTDAERTTLEEFTRILSLSLSRYTARIKAGELSGVKRTLNMMFSLSDQFDPIIVLNPETGEYDWFQSKAQEIEDLTSMSIHGDNLYKNIGIDGSTIIHEDDREQYKAFYTKENMMKIAETGQSQETENRWQVGPDNTYLWKYNKAVRMIDENGKVFVVVGVVDTTEKKEEENRLIEAYKQLEVARSLAEAANNAKTDFLFNMSHDIRTPMNAIRGFTTMAKKNAGNEDKVIEYLDKIDISGQQLLTLINQVLEMARIESGKLEFEEKPINVTEEYNSMITILSEQSDSRGLRFTHTLGNIEHNHILADEARMGSVTLNIVGNAMKYTPEGGCVEFNLREIPSRKPGYATMVFTVADTGIGMSEEYLKTLYEPFSREKTSTVSKIQGTGLGMSIVKKTIDLMGGDIQVESKLGQGTRFDITVDFKIDENATLRDDGTDNTELVSFEGRRVLLVEDNEMNREIARDILEEQGLIIEDAEDGDVAVEMVQKIIDRGDYSYYDFILMDVQMPRMNGYEATKSIRAMHWPEGTHIPIIAMTANAFEEDRQNAITAGMDEHLAKPVDVQKMFLVLSRYL